MARTVLVTGAGSGIGLETALRLARLGFDVLGVVQRGDQVDYLRQRSGAPGVDGAVDAVALDITDRAARAALIADRPLYGLVNVGAYLALNEVTDADLASAEQLFATLVVAPVQLATLALPAMRERGEGRVVNVASSMLPPGLPLWGWFRAANQALAALTDALRMDTDGDGIDVVLVEPGGIDTPSWDKGAAVLRAWRGVSVSHERDRRARFLPRLRGRARTVTTVAVVVGDALTAGRPRRRYRVGADTAVLGVTNRALPAGVRDLASRAVLGPP